MLNVSPRKIALALARAIAELDDWRRSLGYPSLTTREFMQCWRNIDRLKARIAELEAQTDANME